MTYEQVRELVLLFGLPLFVVLLFIFGFVKSKDSWWEMGRSHREQMTDKDKQISQLQAWRVNDGERITAAEKRADRAERNLEKILPVLERNTELVESAVEGFPKLTEAVQRVEIGQATLLERVPPR